MKSKIFILIALILFSNYKSSEAINLNKKNLITAAGALSTAVGFYLTQRTVKIDFNKDIIQITKTGKTTSVSTISRDRKLGSALLYGGIIALFYGLS